MDYVKGVAIGLVYFLIFFVVYFVVSLPLYAGVIWVFGEVSFSERWMSAIPYLGARGLQVAVCALAGASAAAWACSRLVNVRTVHIALATFLVLELGLLVAGVISGDIPEWVEIVFSLSAVLVGYFIGAELMGKAVARQLRRS